MSMWSVGGGRLTGVLRDDARPSRAGRLGVLVLLLLAALGCAALSGLVLLDPEGHEVVLGTLQMFGHGGLRMRNFSANSRCEHRRGVS